MNKAALKKFFIEDNLLIIIDGFLIGLVLIGFLIFGLSDPKDTFTKTVDSYTNSQQSYEESFIRRYQLDDYTKDEPYFVLNPYKMSPLSGLLMFETETETSFKIVVVGKTADANIEFTTESTKDHYIPVYGLYPEYLNMIELYEISGDIETLVSTTVIYTPGLPKEITFPTVIETTHEYFGDDLMMLMPALGSYPVAYDYNGDVRWYLSSKLTWAPVMLENGHLLLGTDRLVADPYYTTGLYEIDYLGKVYAEYTLPGGYHHDVFEMSNGNLLVGTSDFDGTVEDVVVELERTSGDIINTWDIEDYLPELDGMAEMWTSFDWFHNNSIFYDESTDSIILSGRHQDAVISIDYSTNDLNWVLGDPENWGTDFVDAYFFTSIGDNFEWQYAQHSAIALDNGNIFLFDNGNNRSKLRESDVLAEDNYSRGVIYDIDTTNMTIQQVYQFGKELGSAFYSPYISNVEYYADDNYLIHSGGYGEVSGETLNIPAPLSEDFQSALLNSITIEVLDGEEVYRLEVNSNFYRAKRISLYTDLTTYDLGPAEILGKFIVTETTDETFEDGFKFFDTVPPRYEVDLLKEEDRFVVNGVFDNTEIVYLILENSDNKYVYHIPTGSNTYTAMCTIVSDGDDSIVSFYVNEEGISGTYKVYLNIDGHKFDLYKKVIFN